MIEKIKAFYRNSPRRIALSWVVVHVFFLLVGALGLEHINDFGFPSAFFLLLLMIWLFPSASLGYLGDVFILAVPFGYYLLFIYMCLKAKNTSSKHFIFSFTVFTVWFLLSLCLNLWAVFATIF